MTSGSVPLAVRAAAPFTYRATCLAIHDGDTATFSIQVARWRRNDTDLGGFHLYVEHDRLCLHTAVRFLGINAPELATAAGKDALAYLRTLLAVGDVVTLRSSPGKPITTDKYGNRWDAVITRPDGLVINDAMVTAGHAVPYLT